MWISIGKYSQNIKIKRVTTWNNNKVTKNHEYCSTNKAKGWAFSKWCDHALPQWTKINSNIIHSLAKFSWDTSLEKCLWCSSSPLPLPMLSISNHVSKPYCILSSIDRGRESRDLPTDKVAFLRWHFSFTYYDMLKNENNWEFSRDWKVTFVSMSSNNHYQIIRVLSVKWFYLT